MITESEDASASDITVPTPKRHGAAWGNEEFHLLLDGIEQGLTLKQHLDRHQRTAGSIAHAASRLIPLELRPENLTRSLEILAKYLRENERVDRVSLVYATCPGPRPQTARCVGHGVTGDGLDTGSATAGSLDSKEARVDAGDATPLSAVSASSADVSMLVAAAVAGLSKERERVVLEMRLGLSEEPHTLAEIGTEWGVSRERVRQVQESSLRKLAGRSRIDGTPGYALKLLLQGACASDEALATWLLDVIHSDFETNPALALKIVLRASGFSKTTVSRVSALLPALDRARNAQLRELYRGQAAMEKLESMISRWLAHSDWPVAVTPPPPVTELASQRVVNDTDIAGEFYSDKLGRSVQHESGLELGMIQAFDRSEQVAYYQEQPFLIRYHFQGRKRKYYPDLFIATADGRGLLLEFKPTDAMALSINRAKADAARAWAHARGWGWLVVNNRHTYRQLQEHVIDSGRWVSLDRELKGRGALSWQDMLALRARFGLSRLDVTAYVIQSGAGLDRQYRLTAQHAHTPSSGRWER